MSGAGVNRKDTNRAGRWLNTVQAGLELGVGDAEVRYLIRTGQLPAERRGHPLYVRAEDVARLRAQREAEGRTVRVERVITRLRNGEQLRELAGREGCSMVELVERLVTEAWEREAAR